VSLRVRFLGSGDAFGNGGRFQACIWIRTAGFQALLDCGATSLLALRRWGIDPSQIDAVLVSHFHGDHFGGVPYLVLDGQFRKRTRPLTIAGPRTVEDRTHGSMEEAFAGSSRTAQRFEIRYVELGPAASAVGPLGVRALPVAHTPGSEAVGLRVEVGGRTIAYSGDSEWTDSLRELAAGADLFIAEAYSFEKRIPYHLSYRALDEHLASLGAKRVILTHFGPEMLERLADVRLQVASDGLEIELT
jgi:ribonuclease BN (tRNA processing enzyme)